MGIAGSAVTQEHCKVSPRAEFELSKAAESILTTTGPLTTVRPSAAKSSDVTERSKRLSTGASTGKAKIVSVDQELYNNYNCECGKSNSPDRETCKHCGRKTMDSPPEQVLESRTSNSSSEAPAA